jgi:hypothetical protein
MVLIEVVSSRNHRLNRYLSWLGTWDEGHPLCRWHRADLLGLTKDDVQINLTSTTLTLRGEKKKQEEVKGEAKKRTITIRID